MAKKRTQAAAGIGVASEGSGRKKRKAAEAATAKTKQIVDDENESVEDEGEAVAEVSGHVEEQAIEPKPLAPEEMPLFAPGLRLFEGFSDTIRNTEIAALTKAQPDMEQSQKYGFTLKPLIVTEGPLAGQTILVLQHSATFRFLDLPPEIRNMVYEYLIDEPEHVEIRSHKPVGKPRRPVVASFKYQRYSTHKGLAWDKVNGKWIGRRKASHELLRVCKQIQAETGTLLYGDTLFTFWHWNDMDLFIKTIGGMRRFLRHVGIPDREKGYWKSSTIMRQLQDAVDLQSLAMQHRTICTKAYGDHTANVTRYIWSLKGLMKFFEKQAASETEAPRNVLDLVKVVALDKCVHCEPSPDKPRCYSCRFGGFNGRCAKACRGDYGCTVKCNEQEAHCEALTEVLRGKVAKELKIEVDQGKEVVAGDQES